MTHVSRVQAGAASEAERQLLSELNRELLSSELLRAKTIAAFCGTGALMFLIMERLFADHIELLRHGYAGLVCEWRRRWRC